MNSKLRLLTVIALMAFGIAVMAYPTLSSYINGIHSSRAVQEFSVRMENIDPEALLRQRVLAEQYNAALSGGEAPDQYDSILDFGNGVMGTIRIPKIGVELSIYHGVSETVLQKGVGHLPASALPIGGTGNHCVLTGHTGLPSASLFTDLTELTEGDQFYLQVLGEVLVYEVDQITVVLPHEVDALGPVRGQDHCTLVTCTPYGINSHRLLVRGRRVLTEAADPVRTEALSSGDSLSIPGELVLAGSAMALLLTAGVLVLLQRKREESP